MKKHFHILKICLQNKGAKNIMVWLGNYAMRKSKAVELRLYAPQRERIFLDFLPLKECDEENWNPK